MVKLTKPQVISLLNNFRDKKVLVLGDVMLDRYLWGQVSRLSPEAPVPIVEIEDEYSRLGGAANVGNNIASLGAVPYLVGVIGDDSSGQELSGLMEKDRFSTIGLVKANDRPTTVKTRVIAHSQHVVRIDRENRDPINSPTFEKVKQIVLNLISEVDAVIFEDYNKGLITAELIRFVITEAQRHNKVITVDPKFDHFFEYKGLTVFKPNRRETENILGVRLDNNEQITKSVKSLYEQLKCKSILITLGENGMALFNGDDELKMIPTRAQKVADGSGAGDTVISTLTLALLSGASLEEAASLANYAAGVVCGEVGIAQITRERLLEGMFG